MANIRKTFNIRNGVQVDEDNLIVNSLGLVGIGTSVPTAELDVRGRVVVVGLSSATSTETENFYVTGVSTLSETFIGITSINSGIITASSLSGVVTYYGDGGRLLNLPTSQWLDIDVGLGFTSIYAQGYVGVSTNDPRFAFQVAGTNVISAFQSGVGINSRGDVLITGVTTSYSFVGFGTDLEGLNASNITNGTLSNDRLPVINNDRLPSNISVSGIITAQTHFSGNVVGIASTAIGITSTSIINITGLEVGFVTSTTLRTGIATADTRIYSGGKIGVQTNNPQGDVHVVKTGISSIQVTGTTESTFTIGRSLSQSQNNAGLKFGNTSGVYFYSNTNSFDVINYDSGNFNSYIHYGNVSGINTGNFNWIYGKSLNNPLMTLTYGGNLGIGNTTPYNTLTVSGVGTFASSLFVGNNLNVINNVNVYGATLTCQTLDALNIITDNITLPSSVNISYLTVGIATADKVRIAFSDPPKDSSYPLQVNDLSSGFVVGTNGKVGIKTDILRYSTMDLDCTNASIGALAVAVGRTEFDAAVDFRDAGKGVSITVSGTTYNDPGRFMIVPNVDTTTRDNFPAPKAGGIIYNTSTNKFQGRTNTGWVDLH